MSLSLSTINVTGHHAMSALGQFSLMLHRTGYAFAVVEIVVFDAIYGCPPSTRTSWASKPAIRKSISILTMRDAVGN